MRIEIYLEAFTQSFISEFTVVVEILHCQFRRFGGLGVAHFGDVARRVIKYVTLDWIRCLCYRPNRL
jgi:hypothetical protein